MSKTTVETGKREAGLKYLIQDVACQTATTTTFHPWLLKHYPLFHRLIVVQFQNHWPAILVDLWTCGSEGG